MDASELRQQQQATTYSCDPLTTTNTMPSPSKGYPDTWPTPSPLKLEELALKLEEANSKPLPSRTASSSSQHSPKIVGRKPDAATATHSLPASPPRLHHNKTHTAAPPPPPLPPPISWADDDDPALRPAMVAMASSSESVHRDSKGDGAPTSGAASVPRAQLISSRFNLQDPKVQHFILFDSTVQLAASTVLATSAAARRGYMSRVRGVKSFMKRTDGTKLACAIEADELARIKSFKSVLADFHLVAYYEYVRYMVLNVRRLARASLSPRFASVLADYLRTLEQHHALVAAILPPIEQQHASTATVALAVQRGSLAEYLDSAPNPGSEGEHILTAADDEQTVRSDRPAANHRRSMSLGDVESLQSLQKQLKPEPPFVVRGPSSPVADCSTFTVPRGSCERRIKDAHYIAEPPPCDFLVRGPSYLVDKVKVRPSSSTMRLLGLDLVRTPKRFDHVCGTDGPIARKARELRATHGVDLLVVNFQCPARGGDSVSVLLWWAITPEALADEAFMRMWREFKDMSQPDVVRHKRFKLIPCVVEGNFLVRRVVGSRPVMVKAIKTRYYGGDGYLEVNADIVSSTVATQMWRAVESAARSLVIDLAFVLEASGADELPERLMASVRFHKINLSKAIRLEELESNGPGTPTS